MNDTVLNRRAVLRAGAGVMLFASGGMISACRAGSSIPAGGAYSAWTLWNDASVRGAPLALVAAGVLAANPHDSQPWLFHLTQSEIKIYADTSRNLGAMDPFLREMHIGLGCALENMALAAPANGYTVEIDPAHGSLIQLTDRNGPVLAATMSLARVDAPKAVPPAYAAIPLRHTNRYAYDRNKGLPKAWREALARASGDPNIKLLLLEDGAARAAYDAVVLDSTRALIADSPMIADSDRWLRRSPADIEKYRSGPTLETAGLSATTLMLARMFPVSASVEHQAWFNHTRDVQLATAPLTGFIAVRDRHDRSTALAAGRLWQRLHLSATLAGVAMQPMNQPMEMVDRDQQLGRGPTWEQRLAQVTGAPDWQPTFSFRAGVATHTAPPSPRRALGDVLNKAA